MNEAYAKLVMASLERFWGEIQEVAAPQSETVLREFLQACVRPDLQGKFRDTWWRRGRIGRRFFRGATSLERWKASQKHRGTERAPFSADLILGPATHLYGFRFGGTFGRLEDIVWEEDSIAAIRVRSGVLYAFLSGDLGEHILFWRKRG
jgi:hypothetical protein